MAIWSILQDKPIWVWPLLVLLILIGLRARRTRSVPTVIYYFLPLLGLITLGNVLRLPNLVLIRGAFGGAYVVGVVLGYRVQLRYLIAKEGRRVTLKGERLTLINILILFGLSFAIGIISITAPDIYSHTGFLVCYAVLGGVVAGSFAGRALRIGIA